MLHLGNLLPGGILHHKLPAKVEKFPVGAVDQLLLFVPDIKMVEGHKFFFQIKNHAGSLLFCFFRRNVRKKVPTGKVVTLMIYYKNFQHKEFSFHDQ